jgi:single-strand DNA-binding protein
MTAQRQESELQPIEHRNEVTVVGRLSGAALSRQLPSGDEIVTWRLIVDRTPSKGGSAKARRAFDTIECSAFKARVRRQASTWVAGDVVAVCGSLRHRYWRGSTGGLQSKCEVEVETASRRTTARQRRTAPAAAPDPAVTRPRKLG